MKFLNSVFLIAASIALYQSIMMGMKPLSSEQKSIYIEEVSKKFRTNTDFSFQLGQVINASESPITMIINEEKIPTIPFTIIPAKTALTLEKVIPFSMLKAPCFKEEQPGILLTFKDEKQSRDLAFVINDQWYQLIHNPLNESFEIEDSGPHTLKQFNFLNNMYQENSTNHAETKLPKKNSIVRFDITLDDAGLQNDFTLTRLLLRRNSEYKQYATILRKLHKQKKSFLSYLPVELIACVKDYLGMEVYSYVETKEKEQTIFIPEITKQEKCLIM